MVLALGIEHTTRALNAQSAVDEMTNEMFRRNAETLKQGAMDAALASERGIVDVEPLRKVNADIILSINEVVKIHEEGSKRRAEAQEELARIEDELKQALLEIHLFHNLSHIHLLLFQMYVLFFYYKFLIDFYFL